MTMLSDALSKAGLHQRDAVFDLAIAKVVANYKIHGGSDQAAAARLTAIAQRMSDAVHKPVAENDGHNLADGVGHPTDDGEAARAVAQAQTPFSKPSSPPCDREGQTILANHGQAVSADPVAPSSPTPARPRRGLASIAAVQPIVGRAFLLIHKTSDGRPWGDVGWHELDGMRRDGAIARLIKDRIAEPTDRFARLNDLLTDAQFMEIYNVSQSQIAV